LLNKHKFIIDDCLNLIIFILLQLKYICSAAGCQYFTSNSSDDSDVGGDTLVITRHTKTVRAVEMQTGNEKSVAILVLLHYG